MSQAQLSPRPESGTPLAVDVLVRWLPIWAAVSVLTLLTYVSMQQAYRQGANDPQIQIAEDGARTLAQGAAPGAVVGEAPVDIEVSPAVWTAVVGDDDRVLAANVRLDGRTALPPAGVFDEARRSGENRISWQPRPGVRSATVSVRVPGSSRRVVVAGRSLRETERRVDQLGLRALAAWLGASLASLTAVAFGAWLTRR
jgi:hypothetical protein